jgi:phospholipid transport system substrate-binding protein
MGLKVCLRYLPCDHGTELNFSTPKEEAMHWTHIPLKASALVCSLSMAIAYLLQPGIVSAGSPLDALQTTSQKVRGLLSDMEFKGPEHVADRRYQLMTIIRERFSCEEMSKRALGNEWVKRSEAEQQEFTRLFQALLAKSYASKIEGYGAEPVRYIEEQIANGYAMVRAQIYAAKNQYVMDFRLVETAGSWLVYDVVVDGISLINSYRRQFARVLTYVSYETLVQRMKEKADLPMHARAD